MLGSYSNTNLKINSVSGTLVKNYKDSFFEKFALDSYMADDVFSSNASIHIRDERGRDMIKPVVLLQCMLCGKDKVMCELIWKEDFDKMFEEASI